MKKTFLLLFLVSALRLNAQVLDLSAGMGISLSSTPALNDYINASFATSEDQRPSFTTNVEFYAEAGHQYKEHLQFGLEYAVIIGSYNTINNKVGKYDMAYTIHLPSVLAYYVINGNGYKFKFGGGGGYRYVSLDETLANYSSAVNYTTSGVGFLVKADGNTTLGGNLYANIQALMRLDFTGEPKSSTSVLSYNNIGKEKVNFNSFSVGVRHGLSYFF